MVKADGRWRLFLFADADADANGASDLWSRWAFLTEAAGLPLRRFTRDRADIDTVIDMRAVFPELHKDMVPGSLPAVLAPHEGRFELIDYEKVICLDVRARDIFDLRGTDREAGCLGHRPTRPVRRRGAHVERAAFMVPA